MWYYLFFKNIQYIQIYILDVFNILKTWFKQFKECISNSTSSVIHFVSIWQPVFLWLGVWFNHEVCVWSSNVAAGSQRCSWNQLCLGLPVSSVLRQYTVLSWMCQIKQSLLLYVIMGCNMWSAWELSFVALDWSFRGENSIWVKSSTRTWIKSKWVSSS